MVQRESDLQKAVVSYVKSIGYGRFLFFIHNNAVLKSRLQLAKMGQRSGAPDLFLAYPSPSGAHGLWLELKRKGMSPRLNQLDCLTLLANVGYVTAWADNLRDAVFSINNYLGISMT